MCIDKLYRAVSVIEGLFFSVACLPIDPRSRRVTAMKRKRSRDPIRGHVTRISASTSQLPLRAFPDVALKGLVMEMQLF